MVRKGYREKPRITSPKHRLMSDADEIYGIVDGYIDFEPIEVNREIKVAVSIIKKEARRLRDYASKLD